MAEASYFCRAVDALLQQQKMLAGEPSWQLGPYGGCLRWLSPLSIGGITTGMNLYVDAFPRNPDLEFHIVLTYEVCVSRIDFSDVDRHRNHAVKRVPTPLNIELGWLYGPHFHRWQDNRGLVVLGAKPKELQFAAKLPQNIRAFDQAFWHFCEDTKILVAANQIPVLPKKDVLL